MTISSNNVDVFVNTVGGTGTTLFNGFFGDGVDGNVTINSTVTLTRDWYYNNLTIGATGILKPRGFHIFVKGTLTIDVGGSINDNGNNAYPAGTTSPADNGGAALPNVGTGFGAASGAGGNGINSASTGGNGGGSVSNCSTNVLGLSPRGGTGGACYDPELGPPPVIVNPGGLGGNATSPTIPQRWPSIWSMMTARLYNGGTWNGGSGGGGGSGFSPAPTTANTGGGGGGGGIVWIGAKTIVNAGSITANGGAGADGAVSGPTGLGCVAGGGAGGGGGLVGIVTTTATSLGTITANVGANGVTVGDTGLTIQPISGNNGTVSVLILS